jgi:hypothetical protein
MIIFLLLWQSVLQYIDEQLHRSARLASSVNQEQLVHGDKPVMIGTG